MMHHSKRQSHRFLLVMLRLELHAIFILAIGKPTLGLLPRYTSCFSRCSRRCPILNCFNLDGVNVNSLTVNHVPEKLHDTDLEITFGELDQIVPAFPKELICRVLELLVSLLELNQFRILLGELEEGQVDLQGKLLEIL
ncbi:hypothetical protein Tco_1250204 [Tanacetum coccineum]